MTTPLPSAHGLVLSWDREKRLLRGELRRWVGPASGVAHGWVGYEGATVTLATGATAKVLRAVPGGALTTAWEGGPDPRPGDEYEAVP